MKKINDILKGIGILIGLNIAYLLFLTACFMLPVDSICKNVETSLEIWVDVQDPTVMDYPVFDQISLFWDSFSDMIWANMATIKGNNPIISAIRLDWYQGNSPWEGLVNAIYYRDSGTLAPYSRYWNINVGVLKIFFSYATLSEIRFLFYWVSSALLIFLLYRVMKIQGVKGAIPLIAAFMMISLELHAICLSFSGEIVLLLASMIFLTYYLPTPPRKFKIYHIFLGLGSLTFAVGPFVTPVLTIGMCLILSIQLMEENCDCNKVCKFVITNTISWIIGYIMTLLFKGFLSRIFLGHSDGVSEALMWFGAEMGISQRFSLLGNKLIRCFTPTVVKVPAFIILLLVLLFLCYKRKRRANRYKSLALGFIALYPFIWVLLVSRHSIHLFTSHLFAVTIYAIISILLNHTSYGETAYSEH